MVEFLEKFTPVNEFLISDHLEKSELKKKTRRNIPSKEFNAITQVMTQMLDLLKRIKVKPKSNEKTYSLDYYFSRVSESDRCKYDCDIDRFDPEYYLPIAATQQDIKAFTKFYTLIDKWEEIALTGTKPINISKSLRCCCCRNT